MYVCIYLFIYWKVYFSYVLSSHSITAKHCILHCCEAMAFLFSPPFTPCPLPRSEYLSYSIAAKQWYSIAAKQWFFVFPHSHPALSHAQNTSATPLLRSTGTSLLQSNLFLVFSLFTHCPPHAQNTSVTPLLRSNGTPLLHSNDLKTCMAFSDDPRN